ncbi:hypothetical protein K7X08_017545 [Anisodus acutangulus]|uniref:RNA exonuclease 4 n=1 Tax=Anisodus acutangulus TaxID=402998 RepID=A0A9Q1LUC2_9SOLA|nr:hypothetical protein K7X08_017545 [Anisodus acutangulus]
MAKLGIQDDLRIENSRGTVVALSCKMVGGGIDGSLDLCARVCLIDEHERIIFHSYVAPNLPVTNYRYETTGIRPEHLRDAVPLKEVSRKIQDYLCNGEPIWQIRSRSGSARILVGHGLDHDLKCLDLEYPAIMIRDTSIYPPLLKTSKLSNSLKYLTKAYLGYDIQTGVQDPYDECVATMKLYMRMKSQAHKREDYPLANDPQNRNNFASWRQTIEPQEAQLERLEKPSYTKWLDGMLEQGKSVLYIAFGTQAEISPEQLKEIKIGLEKSEVNFLWVVRKRERSRFSKPLWVELVIESICAKVLILAWPMMAEQHLNARMVVEEIKIWLRVETCDGSVRGFVKCEGLEEPIRKLMEGEHGKEARKKVKQLVIQSKVDHRGKR